MTSRVVSPVFAGRSAELAMLSSAFEDAVAGMPGTVLVGAEAGGGKSRLVGEFAARVAGRALVLAGGCVELSAAGLPYAPFTAALRQLARERGTAEVAALLGGQGPGELAGLLPGLGAPLGGTDPDAARGRLFELALTLLEALAGQRPLVLVVEDVHWADRSTRDLLGFLVRNLRDAAVLLLVTFRSDELRRAHPLRPLLAELGRMEGVTRLELPRLSREEVSAQLEGILGRPPDAAVTKAVYDRGGGVPLFTEALLDAEGTVSPGLPGSLRDLLVGAVEELPEQTQQVLRAATVGGARVGHELLAAVSGLDDAALVAAMRPAVSANVMVADADGYAFRHELIREAVREDLLPGERARAERAFAEALEADPALSPDGMAALQLALHWRGAHEHERALRAAWAAAAGAGAAFAFAEQLLMLEQVLDLWERVPKAAEHTGADRAGVMALAADRRQAPAGDHGGQDLRADALTVLTALATARAPLSADQLTRALGWPLPRTAAAIAAAQDNPDLGGPLALRRVPPETWTVTPRLDILSQAQRCDLRDTTGAAVLDDDQARVLLAALAAGQKWQSDAYPGLRARPGWAAAEAALKEAGLIYSISGPDEVHVSDDVLFSLRYRDDDHIARELGEPGPLHQAATYPAQDARPRPGARE